MITFISLICTQHDVKAWEQLQVVQKYLRQQFYTMATVIILIIELVISEIFWDSTQLFSNTFPQTKRNGNIILKYLMLHTIHKLN